MSTNDGGVAAMIKELGTEQSLVERLRTDALWLRRRQNETIARDCQHAADEIEKLSNSLTQAKAAELKSLGWELSRCADGSIAITGKDGMSVVVNKQSICAREIPEEVLYALAESLLA